MGALASFGWSTVTLFLFGSLLMIGRGFFIPLVVAFALAYLINTLSQGVSSLPIGSRRIPPWLARIIILLGALAATHFLVLMIASNIGQLAIEIPSYQEKLIHKIQGIYDSLGIPLPREYSGFTDKIDLVSITGIVFRTATEIASSAGLIAIYTLFFLMEFGAVHQKLEAIYPQQTRKDATVALLQKIGRRINRYLRIKTALSLLTAICSYGVLIYIGVDFAALCSLFAFLLNFIPTIGSFLATLFPIILAFVQFDNYAPLVATLVLLGAVQISIGNILEPRVMGRSFNLSGLVILLSLSVWAYIWGVVGMILSVPIMVMMSIVLANYPPTRWIAILLSQDGKID